MRVAVTGSHGLIGTALVRALRADGHGVVLLVRGAAGGPDEVSWDPAAGVLDPAALAGVDAVVNLAGAGVGDHRWTAAYKRTLVQSRVLTTRTLVTALGTVDPAPRVLVSGSAIGAYGDRGDEVLTEDSARGNTFLADLVRDWEAESDRARAAGIRVVNPRTGLVLARHGGAFQPLLRLSRLGLGGPIGNGRQWWSWITLPDTVRALRFMIDSPDLTGPVNLTAPTPERNRDVMRALGRALRRPALLPAPAPALRILLGEFAGDILASQRVVPKALTRAGFTFEHASVDEAACWVTH
jgi:uncharacterized protein (TIGR01777 family)